MTTINTISYQLISFNAVRGSDQLFLQTNSLKGKRSAQSITRIVAKLIKN